MNNSEFNLDVIHQRSFGNEQQLKSAEHAGCFDCLSVFPVIDIKAWVDDKSIRTALCPKCSTDSVLADYGAVSFSLEMLKAEHD
jgi:Zn finger protein HypA/HybF involved in hydrogenase expression